MIIRSVSPLIMSLFLPLRQWSSYFVFFYSFLFCFAAFESVTRLQRNCTTVVSKYTHSSKTQKNITEMSCMDDDYINTNPTLVFILNMPFQCLRNHSETEGITTLGLPSTRTDISSNYPELLSVPKYIYHTVNILHIHIYILFRGVIH